MNDSELSTLGLMATFVSIDILKHGLQSGCSAFDIGCGSGYISAIMANMIGEHGQVVALDHNEHAILTAKKNITNFYPHLLNRIKFVHQDAWKGCHKLSPFDAIHVGSAVERISLVWLNHLKWGGVMSVPILPSNQSFDNDEVGIDVAKNGNRLNWQGRKPHTQILYKVFKGFDQRITETPVIEVNYEPLQ
eukprot:TRINITY_DN1672_c0_g1_i4.p2 TRINITY_DN1672_c0_g1~~TRINITY_DN1672_c0_g1_i4.p2  ORF type:complete len:191 (-),score=28.28 TRINITY_DN1672_c0_g1_i4:200-772(-)